MRYSAYLGEQPGIGNGKSLKRLYLAADAFNLVQ
jgi:hypothetical protein